MKKYSLFKVLMIGVLIVAALSWVIPASVISGGEATNLRLNPLGINDLSRVFFMTLSEYFPYGLFILTIGAFYGVLNKAGGYQNLVEVFVKGFKREEDKFLFITFLFFTVLSAVGGSHYVLLILVPFFVTVLIKLNHTKLIAMASTFGAILLGNFASLYGFQVSGYINHFFGLGANDNILIKLILFVASIIVVYLIYTSNFKFKPTKKESKDIPLYEDEKDKKSYWPVAIFMDAIVLFFLIATFNFNSAFEVTYFRELHTRVVEFELLGIRLFNALFGKMNAIGDYGLIDVIVLLGLFTLIFALVNKLKADEIIESSLNGIKDVYKVAFFVIFANIILAAVTYGSQTFFNTLIFYVVDLFKDSVLVVSVFLPVVAGLFVNSISMFTSEFVHIVRPVLDEPSNAFIIGLGLQTFHSILMAVLPTSIILIAGITYLDVSYKDWLNFIKKYLYALSALSFVLIVLLSLFL